MAHQTMSMLGAAIRDVTRTGEGWTALVLFEL
jgi:hypothetical protein